MDKTLDQKECGGFESAEKTSFGAENKKDEGKLQSVEFNEVLRRSSVSSSINISTTSVKRRLAFLWRCCCCCFCSPSKCCRCCFCHKKYCCGCCCHEFYHRKIQTDAYSLIGNGGVVVSERNSSSLSTGRVGAVSSKFVQCPDEQTVATVNLLDNWSFLVYTCIAPPWQTVAHNMGKEKFMARFSNRVLKNRDLVPYGVYPEYDELMKSWKTDVNEDLEKSKALMELFLDVENKTRNASSNLSSPHTPKYATCTLSSPTDKRVSHVVENNSTTQTKSLSCDEAVTAAYTIPISRSLFSRASGDESSPKEEKREAEKSSKEVTITSEVNSIVPPPCSNGPLLQPPSPSQHNLDLLQFEAAAKINTSTATATSPTAEATTQTFNEVAVKFDDEGGKKSVDFAAVASTEDDGDEEESSSEEDDDEEEEEEELLTTKKKITRIIRLDPDGQRKEFVYEGDGIEDTDILIEKAIAEYSPYGTMPTATGTGATVLTQSHQSATDQNDHVTTSTRRVVLKKQIVKRTVIKDGEPDETTVETSHQFSEGVDNMGGIVGAGDIDINDVTGFEEEYSQPVRTNNVGMK